MATDTALGVEVAAKAPTPTAAVATAVTAATGDGSTSTNSSSASDGTMANLSEAGSGRWLGVRYPTGTHGPLTAAQARAAVEARLKAARKASHAAKKAEEAARARSRKALRQRGGAGAGLCGTGVGPDLSLLGESDNGGLCGLYNLGNTCFLSAALQCLSMSLPLTHYFRSGLFVRELNRDNQLGFHGRLATAYARLIKTMWSSALGGRDGGGADALEPKQFKATIGQCRPQFAGNQQHDAQELLAFLLDGLHEDLNRVKIKPYVPLPDSAGRPDAVVAREQWSAYRARDDRVIVDLFTGLLKSSLRFDCGRVSTAFDPYTSLSLPLPKERIKHVEVTLVWQEREEEVDADEEDDESQAQAHGAAGADAAASTNAADSSTKPRKRRFRARVPTKYCIEIDSSAAAAAAAAAATAAAASKTVMATSASASVSAPSLSSSQQSVVSSAIASQSLDPTGASDSNNGGAVRRGLAASARVLDIKLALSRLSGVHASRLQLARLQLSHFDVWKRRAWGFLQNYMQLSDFSLSMQAASGPQGNKNDIYIAFELPDTPPSPPTPAPVVQQQQPVQPQPFVHDGMPEAHGAQSVTPAVAAAVPVAVTPVTTPAAPASAPAAASSPPPAPAPVASSFPVSYGSTSGLVSLGTKFDVKDSVARWEVATVIDIRVLVPVESMIQAGGSLAVVTTSAAAAPATTNVTAPAAAPTPEQAAATHRQPSLLRKHSSTVLDGPRFRSESDAGAAEQDVAAGSEAAPSTTSAVSASAVAADDAVAPVTQQPQVANASDDAVALPTGSPTEAAAVHFHNDAADEDEDEDKAGTQPAPTSAAAVAASPAPARTAADVSSPAPSATAAAASSSSAAADSSPRYSASPFPGLVYQHGSSIPRRLPASHPSVELLFSFDGFSTKWNEWVPLASARIAPYGSGLVRTHGRHNHPAAGGHTSGAPMLGSSASPYGSTSTSTSQFAAASAVGFGYGGSGEHESEAGWVRIHVLQRVQGPLPPYLLRGMETNAATQQQRDSQTATTSQPTSGGNGSNGRGVSTLVPPSSGGTGAASPAPIANSSSSPPAAASAASTSGSPAPPPPPPPYDLQVFSVPLMLWLDPRTTTAAQLYEQCWRKVRRFTRLPDSITPGDVEHTPTPHATMQEDANEQAAPLSRKPSTASRAGNDAAAVEMPPLSAAGDQSRPALPASALTSRSAPSLPAEFFARSLAPFVLRYSLHSGLQCSKCATSSKQCLGCPIELVNDEETKAFLQQQEQQAAGKDVEQAAAAGADATSASAATSSSSSLPARLARDNPLVCDRLPHQRSWHGDCSLVLDWNMDYLRAGLVDLVSMQALQLDGSVLSFRERARRDDHASKVDLNVCLAMFTSSERLSGDAAVYCSACKEHEEATKTLELYSTPPLLVLHLKRLLPDAKLFTDVRFPLRGFDPMPFLAREGPPAASAAAASKPTAAGDADGEVATKTASLSAAGRGTYAGVGSVVLECEEEEKSTQSTGGAEADAAIAAAPLGTDVDASSAAGGTEQPVVGDVVRPDAVQLDLPQGDAADQQLAERVEAIVRSLNSGPASDAKNHVDGAPAAEQPYRVEVTQAAGTTEAAGAVANPVASSTDGPAAVADGAPTHLAAPKPTTAAPLTASVLSPSPSPSPSLSPSATPTPAAGAAHAADVAPRSATATPAVAAAAIPSAIPVATFTPVPGGFDASVSAASLAASKQQQAAASGKRGKSKGAADNNGNSGGDVYDLYAVVNHHGALGGGGHYTVFALSRSTGEWFHFDDHRVTLIPAAEVQARVVSPAAYMLFYEKRGLKRTAGVDACPPEVRNRALDAAQRRILRSTDQAGEATCAPFCALQ